MFILLISRGTPSKHAPQWGCFEKDQAEALTALGHKVVVASVDSRFRLIPRKLGLTHTVINGINYYSSFYIPGALSRKLGGFKFNLFLKLLQLKRIYKHIIKVYGTPDIVYSHYLSNTYLATKLKDKYDIPIVAIEHWSKLNSDQLPFDALFMGNYAYRKVNALISVSESLRQRLLQHFNMSSVVVYNMVGSEFINRPISPRKKDEDGIVNFVSVGSLFYGKGFDILIKAFAKLKKSNYKLCIIGEGNLHKDLQDLIDGNKLSDQIFLLGQKNKEEIVEILNQSDVFVLSSRAETFGVVYIEAMMLGLPVIATSCGGPEEFVQKSNGMLIPTENVDALSEALLFMCTNYKTYNRKLIAEDCRERFSPQTIAKQLVDIFESVKE